MIRLDDGKRTRAASLTPMIDVVFLLLIFFMLAAKFDREEAIDMAEAGGSIDYSGPPRLVVIGAESLALNGTRMELGALSRALADLTEDQEDIVVLRPLEDVPLQRMVDVMLALEAEGFAQLMVIE